MKKTVLTFGLISGVIISTLMSTSLVFSQRIGFGHSMVLGYTIMVASMLLVYFGVRSYRDNVLGGAISFGRALGVGSLIMLISCACYVISWEILSHFFMPDFMDKYCAYALDQAKAAGASAAELQKQVVKMAETKKLLANPFINVVMTFIEPLPVGILMALLSAALLKKKPSATPSASAVPAT